MVNMENYEEYMLLYADGELKPEEEKALLAFVAQHPELEAELKAYAATRLQPDTSMVFEHKDSLMKTAEPTRRIALGNWKIYAAAACILLVAVLFIINRNKHEQTDVIAVEEKITEEPVTKTETQPIQEQVNDTTLNNITPGKRVHSTSPVNTIAVKHNETKKAPVNDIQPKPQQLPKQTMQQEPQNIANNRSNRDTAMKTIANNTPVEHSKGEPEAEPQVPKHHETMPGKKQNKANRFIAAVLGDKPQGVAALENAVDQKLAAAKEFGKEVRDTEVKLRLGKKELLIVRL